MKNLTDFRKTVETGVDPRLDTVLQARDRGKGIAVATSYWTLCGGERERVRLITLNKVDSVKLTLKAAKEMTLSVVATTTTLFLKI